MLTFRRRPSPVFVCCAFYSLVFVWCVVANFPRDTDEQQTAAAREQAARQFYRQAYSAPDAVDTDKEARYVEIARKYAKAANIDGVVQSFVSEYQLAGKRVLDVGAGRGYLQDMVADYTALDISPSVRRFYHKPFVLGSATAMPFRDGEFDAAWSIWVLEHVPNPEQALSEMRRVLKPGGLLLLMPGWQCSGLAADGYTVRPYGDFGLHGKWVKATAGFRILGTQMSAPAIRALRRISVSGETRFHYRRLIPNYETYWQPDSDAVNSMDAHEAVMWFESRGDRCRNCSPSALGKIWSPPGALIIQVGKPTRPADPAAVPVAGYPSSPDQL